MSTPARFASLLLATALLSACSAVPALDLPPPPVPTSWAANDPLLRQSEATLPSLEWRSVFADAALQSLVTRALAGNRDVAAAAADVAAARARLSIQRAARLPQVTASAGAGVAGDTDDARGDLSLGIGVPAFEIDLFGRVAALTEAERQRFFASEAGARATRLALVGTIGDAWIAHAAEATLLTIAEDTAGNARRAVQLTRARLDGGIAPRTDLRAAEQILATAEADVARQQTAVAQAANAIDLLVGAPVDRASLPRDIETAAAVIGEAPAGIDSAILLRRPDVLSAEYRLRAANAEIGAARAALFPTISLTGLAGLASDALGSLLSGGAFAFSGGADARYAIFQGGAGRARVAVTEAQRDAAIAEYEGAIQRAFRDVADALARTATIGAEERAVRANVAASADRLALTDARYRAGVDNFLSRLDAQRALYAARRTLVGTLAARAGGRIALYRALGGDASLTDGAPPLATAPR